MLKKIWLKNLSSLSLPSFKRCRVGQGVKTPPFHGGVTGSIPVRGTKAFHANGRLFCFRTADKNRQKNTLKNTEVSRVPCLLDAVRQGFPYVVQKPFMQMEGFFVATALAQSCTRIVILKFCKVLSTHAVLLPRKK